MKHEQMSDVNVTELIRRSREQRAQREANNSNQGRTPIASSTVKVVNHSSDLNATKHGEYVQTEDGIGAIVIDHEEQARKMRENDKTGKALLQLVNSAELISDVNDNYVPDYGEDAPEGYDPGQQWIDEHKYDPKTGELIKMRKGFSTLSFGIEGLVESNSEEARIVQEAMEKLRSGEVVLPTPDEYRAQKEEQERKRKERQARLNEKRANRSQQTVRKPANSQPVQNIQPTNPVPEEPESEPQMAQMPENVIIRKGVEQQMAELVQTNKTAQSGATGSQMATKPVSVKTVGTGNNVVPAQQPVHTVQKQPATEQLQTNGIPEEKTAMSQTYGEDVGGLIVNTPEKENTNNQTEQVTQPEQSTVTQKTAPLNLAEMERDLEEMVGEDTQHENGDNGGTQEPVTVINVEKGQAENVIRQLPLETYEKVVRSESIQVNEVELKNVPVASRKVTSIADYRALAQRRGKNRAAAEVAERVLINSGFVITVKSATSMEMASIFKSTVNNETDWAKMYQFCYEHTVDSSIGRMGYNSFVAYVSPSDVETVLDGIYEISETDERSVELNCGPAEGGCGRSYAVQFKPSELPNISSLPEKSKARIKEIIEIRHDIAKAKEYQENSPTCKVKCVQMGDRTMHIRVTTGHMMIERIERIDEINARYNALIALLILYVEKITVLVPIRDDVDPEPVDLEDIDIICEELKTLTDDELEQVKYIVAEGLDDYQPVTYSLKGHFTCPNCGLVKKDVPCSISDLVFQKVQRMLE